MDWMELDCTTHRRSFMGSRSYVYIGLFALHKKSLIAVEIFEDRSSDVTILLMIMGSIWKGNDWRVLQCDGDLRSNRVHDLFYSLS